MKILVIGKAKQDYAVSSEVWDARAFRNLGNNVRVATVEDEPAKLIRKILACGKGWDVIFYAFQKALRADVIYATKRVAKRSVVSSYDHLFWGGNSRFIEYEKCAKLVDLAVHTGTGTDIKGSLMARQGCEPLEGLKTPVFTYTGAPAFVGGKGKDREELFSLLTKHHCDILGTGKNNQVRRQDLYNLCTQRTLLLGHIRTASGAGLYDSRFPQYRSNRLNVLAGFGACMLHPYHPGIEDEYEEDKEILLFRTWQEMEEKIDKYSKDIQICKAIGMMAQKRAQSCHTYETRARKILDTVQERSNYAS